MFHDSTLSSCSTQRNISTSSPSRTDSCTDQSVESLASTSTTLDEVGNLFRRCYRETIAMEAEASKDSVCPKSYNVKPECRSVILLTESIGFKQASS